MNTTTQKFCAYAGPLLAVLFFLGLWPAAGFFPPHLPTASAEEIVTIYRQNESGIRLGTILLLVAGSLMAPFAAVIATQMKRIEGASPVLTYTQLVAAAAGIPLFYMTSLLWTCAAFRPEYSPDITWMLNDLGWLFVVFPFAIIVVQILAIGGAILSDKRANPVFPRWAGFFNLWAALLFVPGGLCTYFKTGPFAWNGVLAFWVPATVFGLWFGSMSFLLLRAIGQQTREVEDVALRTGTAIR